MSDSAGGATHTNEPTRIRLLLLDVDGVLTDGRVYMDGQGHEMLAFSIQDGVALKLWQRTGRLVGILSGRDQPAVRTRAGQLGIDLLVLGRDDKLDAYKRMLADLSVPDDAVAFVGDDLLDLPVLARCGYPIAVANAVDAVKATVRYVTTRPGSHGAVSEAVEHLLALAGEWDACVATYRSGQAGRGR